MGPGSPPWRPPKPSRRSLQLCSRQRLRRYLQSLLSWAWLCRNWVTRTALERYLVFVGRRSYSSVLLHSKNQREHWMASFVISSVVQAAWKDNLERDRYVSSIVS